MWLRVLPALLALLIVALALGFAFIQGPGKATLPNGARQGNPGDGYDGTLALPARQAPAIDLRSYLGGRRVTLAEYRGKAVLVTFLYANCPNVCPLIASNLHTVLGLLGRRDSKVQVIAVSVDPRGDTAAAVARFLGEHQMTGRMQYLVGSAAELSRTWAAWGVGAKAEIGQPDLVAHSALVYGVSATGALTTIYPATFEPRQIAHDVPKLASE